MTSPSSLHGLLHHTTENRSTSTVPYVPGCIEQALSGVASYLRLSAEPLVQGSGLPATCAVTIFLPKWCWVDVDFHSHAVFGPENGAIRSGQSTLVFLAGGHTLPEIKFLV